MLPTRSHGSSSASAAEKALTFWMSSSALMPTWPTAPTHRRREYTTRHDTRHTTHATHTHAPPLRRYLPPGTRHLCGWGLCAGPLVLCGGVPRPPPQAERRWAAREGTCSSCSAAVPGVAGLSVRSRDGRTSIGAVALTKGREG
jgi:hypothetical protein